MAELMGEDVVHVTVKKDVRESKLTLLWALRNLGAEKVCILHVHQPKRASPSGGKLEEFEAIMYETLHDYFDVCQQEGVNEDDIYVSCIEINDVRQGILELIHESKIKKLVMGAAADLHYSEEMFDLKSRKASFVYQHAPGSCEIWFTCKGYLIRAKEVLVDHVDDADASPGSWKTKHSSVSPKDSSELVSAIVAYNDTRRYRHKLESTASEDHSEESRRNDRIYRRLKQALEEVEKSKREAFEECVRRFKAEKAAVDAIRRAREGEVMYKEEMRLRREAKEALAKQKKVLEKTKQERDDALVIILNGRKLYNEELRCRVEAEEILAKEQEEHEGTKKEIEELRLIVQDGMQLYNEQMRQKKETEDCMKKQEEELEKTRKEKDEACLLSKNLMQLYEEELRQKKETEEALKRRKDELDKMKKEKDEACSVGQNFMRLYEEEVKRRKVAEEELGREREELEKNKTEKDAAHSVCLEILMHLQKYTREHGSPGKILAEGTSPHQPPSYFICPISQEIMREPQVAADGFTYEAEALREWLSSGRETSPMTNLKLTHQNLVPNHVLRSAIQEWLQHHSDSLINHQSGEA